MRKLFTIVFFIITNSGCAQSYLLQWSDSTKAPGVASFDVLQGADSMNLLTIGNIPAAHNSINNYSYTVPGPTYYYQVKVNSSVKTVYSNKVLVYAVLPVTIINYGITPAKTSVTIYWTSQNENNLKSYEIDRSYDGVNFTAVSGPFSPKGNSTYQVVINRPSTTVTTCVKKWMGICWKKQTVTTVDSRKGIYRVISIDFDGVKTTLKTVAE